MTTRAKWIAGLATLAVAGALSSVALAVGFAELKVSVPKDSTPVDRSVRLVVKGDAPSRVELLTFLSMQPCKTTAPEEMAVKQAKRVGVASHSVDGKFDVGSGGFNYTVDAKGKHYLCAYLYDPTRPAKPRDLRTLAHDGASFLMVAANG
jgi:hypothetical protein